MHKCPKCGSFNTRKSRRKPSQWSWRRPFPSWFRCRDCSTRFLRVDWSKAHRWVAISGAACAALALGAWAVTRDPPPLPPFRAESRPPLPTSPVSDLLLYTDAPTQQAAASGSADAQYRLGLELLQRNREHNDRAALEEAIEWIHKAAGQEHVRAQLALGALYEKGRGVIQDYKEAVAWYRRAASHGEPEAMLRLGQMTEAGRGVEKNLQDAYVWLNLAAARGDQRAEMSRDRVRNLLSPDQVNAAQDRSRSLEQKLPHLAGTAGTLPSDL